MSERPDQYGFGSFQQTAAVAASGGLTMTVSGVAKQTTMVSGLQVSGDAAALVSVESPSGTTIWRLRYTAAFHDCIPFNDDSALVGASPGADVLVKISASTSNAEANVQGFKKQ